MILTKIGLNRQILEYIQDIKFHENMLVILKLLNADR
jgi:hypothetical protein